MSEAVETATLFRREAEQNRSELSALQMAMEEVGVANGGVKLSANQPCRWSMRI